MEKQPTSLQICLDIRDPDLETEVLTTLEAQIPYGLAHIFHHQRSSLDEPQPAADVVIQQALNPQVGDSDLRLAHNRYKHHSNPDAVIFLAENLAIRSTAQQVGFKNKITRWQNEDVLPKHLHNLTWAQVNRSLVPTLRTIFKFEQTKDTHSITPVQHSSPDPVELDDTQPHDPTKLELEPEGQQQEVSNKRRLIRKLINYFKKDSDQEAKV